MSHAEISAALAAANAKYMSVIAKEIKDFDIVRA